MAHMVAGTTLARDIDDALGRGKGIYSDDGVSLPEFSEYVQASAVGISALEDRFCRFATTKKDDSASLLKPGHQIGMVGELTVWSMDGKTDGEITEAMKSFQGMVLKGRVYLTGGLLPPIAVELAWAGKSPENATPAFVIRGLSHETERRQLNTLIEKSSFRKAYPQIVIVFKLETGFILL